VAADRTAVSTGERQDGERLQRILARAGLGSRRGVEELIADGRVRLNGRIAELGNRADAARDQITVDGVPVAADPGLRYYALNKPAGVTSTLRDRHAAATLMELMPKGAPRLVPVGRLDRESEGLLLLTNDGELANRLQHPRYGIEKEYLVEVGGELTPRTATQLVRGIDLDDGPARALSARVVDRSNRRSSLRMVMGEGRKREIRRMLRAVGFEVARLVRVRVGPVHLGRLGPGKTRPLDPEEVRDLYRVTHLETASSR
jgi:pseudouridine synthase